MTSPSRSRLIVLAILASPFLLFLGLLLFWEAAPLPPPPPMPNPNGYVDLVKAARMVNGDPVNFRSMNEQQLAELIATNTEALQLLRAGMSNQCRIPIRFSLTYLQDHLNDLAGLKRLAEVVAAEGRLAGLQGRPDDAARFFVDGVRLANESIRGGVFIDQLVGIAIETINAEGLQKIAGQLDAKSCRVIAAALETLDAQRQAWDEVVQQERDWSRQTYGGIKYELDRLLAHKDLDMIQQGVEQKFKKREQQTRQLLIALAARAYRLEKGKPPASVADLVPDYLKAIPQDPFTGTNMVPTSP